MLISFGGLEIGAIATWYAAIISTIVFINSIRSSAKCQYSINRTQGKKSVKIRIAAVGRMPVFVEKAIFLNATGSYLSSIEILMFMQPNEVKMIYYGTESVVIDDIFSVSIVINGNIICARYIK